jgi:dTDP-4-amino-4,6-dideoxygalactose transaminase
MKMNKTIFTGFAPNITKNDFYIALGFLLLPWKWFSIKSGHYTKQAEKMLQTYFDIKYAFVFDSGRTALQHALTALDINSGDKVLVQAYTCVVVINAIKHAGGVPVYVDINDDFNMNPEDLVNKASGAKVLIIQHTFGTPADMEELLKIARENNLKTIEDCAHSIGAKYDERLTGTLTDIGMLSFGSDKVISCVRGGALITNNTLLGDKIKNIQENLPKPKLIRTLQHLAHVPVFTIGKAFYGIFIGKVIFIIAMKLNIINKIIYPREKKCLVMNEYPSTLPNSLAKILCAQINNIDGVNTHRKEVAKSYKEQINNNLIKHPQYNGSSIFLRYTVLTEHPKKLHSYMKGYNIILGNWYDSVIAPNDIDAACTSYTKGTCLNAERLAARSINLPTNRFIGEKKMQKIIKLINNWNPDESATY